MYAVWKHLVLQGLSDDTIKAIKKCELKELKQDPTERVRDFQKRIDDMYSLYHINWCRLCIRVSAKKVGAKI